MIKLSDRIGIFSLLTIYLYCAQRASNDGFLNSLGLDTDVLSLEFYAILYSGFLDSIQHIFLFLAGYAIFYMFVDVKESFIRSRRGRRCLVTMNRIYKKVFKKVKVKPLRDSKEKQINFLINLIVALCLFLALMVVNEQSGKRKAVKLMTQIQSSYYTHFYVNGIQDDLAFLYCGSKVCAAYNVQKQRTEYFPNSQFSIDNNQVKAFLDNE
ncbi:hypothetical protein [Vibrio algivorus]|uniref:Uncharacterized protein n=1 Tax=Vibrio algivorus TaxID=1667024 RepID=A0A557PFL2_9VIBR|nr:hypothetical protein [Vibrio algivorus]TVO39433.1 hypothetical protein FOF44_02270 [Vibrio algivorus]